MAQEELNNLVDAALEADPLSAMEADDEWTWGPPPTTSEIDIAEDYLTSCFRNTDEFVAKTKSLCTRCGSKEWFLNPSFQFWQDAYVLAKFAKYMDATSLRLSTRKEQWPDGYVKISGKTHKVEVTSAHGARKLGDEYRNVRPSTFDPVEDWIARADSIPKYLDEAIQNKAKRHNIACWLVVYLNISEYGIRQRETERTIFEKKALYAESFEKISVLWKGRFY
jgi:hypothetical protein